MAALLSRIGLLMLLLLASCDTSSSPTAYCVEPPAEERARSSPAVLTVEPNPVAAGTQATLSIAADGLPAGSTIWASAAWQCWDGSGWIDTHQVARGFGARDPVTIEVQPGATTTIPPVGLPIPNSYPILIPEVDPGVYRLEDRLLLPDGESVFGFTYVEALTP